MRQNILSKTFLLLTLLAWAAGSQAGSLPDSLLTSQKVYQIMYSNRPMAEQIVNQMRKQGKESTFTIDELEAAIHYNHMEFAQAAEIYQRMADSKEATEDNEKRMKALNHLSDTYDVMGNRNKLMPVIEELLDLSTRYKNNYYQSLAKMMLGKSLFYEGDQEKGIANVCEAVDLMASTNYPNTNHLLHSQLNVLATLYTDSGQPEKALQAMNRNERVLTEGGGNLGPLEQAQRRNLRFLLARKASLLVKMNHTREADSVYEYRKQITVDGDDPREYFIVDYLRNRGRWDEALEVYGKQRVSMGNMPDTLNNMMLNFKWGLAETYYGKGDYRQAADIYAQALVITDTLKARTARNNAQELEAAYHSAEKERQLNWQRMWIYNLIAAVIFFIILMAVIFHFLNSLAVKNHAMKRVIAEMRTYQEATMGTARVPGESEDKDSDRSIFLRMNRRVINDKLFLSPDINRDMLMRLAGCDKNRLASILKTFAGTNVSGYINAKRAEYAVILLEQHPQYTIKAIGEMCGIENQSTFNRIFKNAYGMTPSEYRQNH